jgi:catechol 2,3-dioxygenase-like lactoylglutathione lyase family enzyme
MLGSSSVIAFAAATDLDRARRFYEQTLGLKLVEQSEFALVFDANRTMLRVTAVERVAEPGYTVLGWQVADLHQAVELLAGKGVAFCRYDGMDQDPSAIWTTPNGDKVAWFPDPDGNTLSLTQFA